MKTCSESFMMYHTAHMWSKSEHSIVCRRLVRNNGWWNLMWTSYSDKRFKTLSEYQRQFFNNSQPNKTWTGKEWYGLTEDPVSPKCRPRICLHRLSRKDYYYTISELTGSGISTILDIVIEVCNAMVKNFWNIAVHSNFLLVKNNSKNVWRPFIRNGNFL